MGRIPKAEIELAKALVDKRLVACAQHDEEADMASAAERAPRRVP